MSSLVHRDIFSPILTPIHSLFIWILFLKSSWFTLRTIRFIRLQLLSLQIFMIINLHPCHNLSNLLPSVSFSHAALNAVLRIFGYCPRAGLFAAATLCRFWNSVATNAWLGFALAAFCAFYAVFASPSQDKLSGLWGGCSFTFHTFCFRDVIAWGFTSQTISHKHGISQEISN